MVIGDDAFLGRLETAAAPQTCAAFRARLPYDAAAIHARWSGEALWMPTGEQVGAPEPENLIGQPRPGQVLWYGGGISEPEVLVPYGGARFACSAGPLRGNHFLTIAQDLERLHRVGQAVLWTGARTVRFEAV
jgi:hypothetical protein